MTTDKSDAAPQWGPKMSALPNDRWRAFVVALYDDDAPLGGKGSGRRGSPGLLNWAVDQAGFKCKDQKTRSVTAQRLATDPRTVAACAEYGQAKLRVGLSPMAYQAVKNMLGNRGPDTTIRQSRPCSIAAIQSRRRTTFGLNRPMSRRRRR
jgi:hypothetical protein